MSNTKKIINSFYLQDELNSDVWNKKGNEYIIKKEIRDRLLKAAEIFINYLDVDFFVHDIIFIGSLVGYNWSEFSDFDVHIIYDFDEGGKDRDLYSELFTLKKTVFNAAHNIRIKGFETEFFVQDIVEKEKSMGSFSLLNNEWIRKPIKENFEVDTKKLKDKTQQWMDIIDGVLENAKDDDLEDAILLVSKYKDKLRKYRVCGLSKEGEYSYENLVFKFLRRNGYISKLENFKNKITDKSLSLEQQNME